MCTKTKKYEDKVKILQEERLKLKIKCSYFGLKHEIVIYWEIISLWWGK